VLEGVLSVIIYPRKFMLENDCYWEYTKNNPYLYILPESIECLDIDTQIEFDVCQELWNKKGAMNNE
jgi:CMP-N-acetylneuraminic acid synthetase